MRKFGRREGCVLANDDVELSQLFPPFSCFSLGAVEKGDCYSLAMYAKGFRAMRDETWKGVSRWGYCVREREINDQRLGDK